MEKIKSRLKFRWFLGVIGIGHLIYLYFSLANDVYKKNFGISEYWHINALGVQFL